MGSPKERGCSSSEQARRVARIRSRESKQRMTQGKLSITHHEMGCREESECG